MLIKFSIFSCKFNRSACITQHQLSLICFFYFECLIKLRTVDSVTCKYAHTFDTLCHLLDIYGQPGRTYINCVPFSKRVIWCQRVLWEWSGREEKGGGSRKKYNKNKRQWNCKINASHVNMKYAYFMTMRQYLKNNKRQVEVRQCTTTRYAVGQWIRYINEVSNICFEFELNCK